LPQKAQRTQKRENRDKENRKKIGTDTIYKWAAKTRKRHKKNGKETVEIFTLRMQKHKAIRFFRLPSG